MLGSIARGAIRAGEAVAGAAGKAGRAVGARAAQEWDELGQAVGGTERLNAGVRTAVNTVVPVGLAGAVIADVMDKSDAEWTETPLPGGKLRITIPAESKYAAELSQRFATVAAPTEDGEGNLVWTLNQREARRFSPSLTPKK